MPLLPCRRWRRRAVSAVLQRFLGGSEQVPPMYSALKRAGQPLYRLARAGVSVERAPRRIELSQLQLVAFTPATLECQALCSKGTYIRVLAEDIALALGTLGHVTALRREYVEPFEAQPMHTLQSLTQGAAGVPPPLLPADWALAHMPEVRLSVAEAQRIRHGQQVLRASGWQPRRACDSTTRRGSSSASVRPTQVARCSRAVCSTCLLRLLTVNRERGVEQAQRSTGRRLAGALDVLLRPGAAETGALARAGRNARGGTR